MHVKSVGVNFLPLARCGSFERGVPSKVLSSPVDINSEFAIVLGKKLRDEEVWMVWNWRVKCQPRHFTAILRVNCEIRR
ncbi:hypothetical protein TNCV_302511 [Trichonephila clavipes]|nr:hypothetical protein TNCV_302511 [Trichonephila clavipes]